jgi:hypothetical protein
LCRLDAASPFCSGWISPEGQENGDFWRSKRSRKVGSGCVDSPLETNSASVTAAELTWPMAKLLLSGHVAAESNVNI